MQSSLFYLNEIIIYILKGILLEDIDKLYRRPWKERVNVLYYMKCLCFMEVCGKRTVIHPVSAEDEVELKGAANDDEGDSTSLTMLNCEETSII